MLPLLPLSTYAGNQLRGLGVNVALSQTPQQLIRPGALLLVLVPLAAAAKLDNPSVAVAANLAGALAAWLFGAALLRRHWPAEARTAAVALEHGRWLKSVVPIGLSIAMLMIDGQIGVLMLGALSDASEAGLYRAANQMGLLSVTGYIAVNTAIAPTIAAAFAKKDLGAVQRAVIQGSRFSFLFTAVVAAVFAIAGVPLIELLFGAAYRGAYLPLIIMLAGWLALSVFGSASVLLNMTHHEQANTWCFGAGLVISLLLSVALIPSFGAVGAATAATGSILVRVAMLWFVSRRRLGLETAIWGRIPAASRSD